MTHHQDLADQLSRTSLMERPGRGSFKLKQSRAGTDSDYGSDFSAGEEDIIARLLADAVQKAARPEPTVVLTAVGERASEVPAVPADDTLGIPDIEDGPSSLFAAAVAEAADSPVVGAVPGKGVQHIERASRTIPMGGDVVVVAAAPNPPSNRDAFGVEDVDIADKGTAAAAAAEEPAKQDTRAPLERFRTFPRKPLSVSDLSSGAYCELQYWYTLTRLPGGRKTRTLAMKAGSKVHQRLEDEAYTTVRVKIAAREEGFALRLWNVIQGLRTLRDTGFTREFEVWGVIDGQVVNGVIDEMSYAAPVAMSGGTGDEDGERTTTTTTAAAGEEMVVEGAASLERRSGFRLQSLMDRYVEQPARKVYVTDVKTRGTTKLPSGTQIRPATIQLNLYHRLLGAMAAGQLDLSVVVARYGLNGQARFSDAFMARMGSLHGEIFGDDDDADADGEDGGEDPPSSSPHNDAPESSSSAGSLKLDDSIRYRTIDQISHLLQEELRVTFFNGADSLGETLAIEYRHRDGGAIIGRHTFAADRPALDAYLASNMAWWAGEREAEGVPVEETYKCRSCEFAEGCEWRVERERENHTRRWGRGL